jgi:isoleucyl-tRNA synthetase
LTRELEVEGVARELVRAVNDLRKEADLALDDRIELQVSVEPSSLSDELAAAGWFEHVARETLATSFDADVAEPDGSAQGVDLAGHGSANLSLRRA